MLMDEAETTREMIRVIFVIFQKIRTDLNNGRLIKRRNKQRV